MFAAIDPSFPPITALIVDDDKAVRDSLKFMLELDGFEVRVYADGKELLKEPHLRGTECVVIDQVMPGISGLETIEMLRRRGHLNPAVLIVSDRNIKVHEDARTRGIAVLEKPFLEHVLVDAIRKAVAPRS